MKTIYMVVKGIGYYTEDKEGRYITILICYRNGEKISKRLEGEGVNTTANRMIITGIIEGVKTLKESCKVKILTHTHFGYCKILKAIKNNREVRGSINKDLLEELRQTIEEGRHEIEVTIEPVFIK